MLAKRFSIKHENHAYVRLLSASPDRGVVSGGTRVLFEVVHNSLTIESDHEMRCRFSSDPLGSHNDDTDIAVVAAELVNATHVLCVTPDW